MSGPTKTAVSCISCWSHEGEQTMCDMGSERDYMENLLNQRFNFLIVFFSIVIAGAVSSNCDIHYTIILIIGAVISCLITLTIWRCQRKLDLIMEALPETHPAKLIDTRAGQRGSVRRIIGYIIPTLCSLILTTGAILACFGITNFAE